MFDQIFERSDAFRRQLAAPLLEERLAYLRHWAGGPEGKQASSCSVFAGHHQTGLRPLFPAAYNRRRSGSLPTVILTWGVNPMERALLFSDHALALRLEAAEANAGAAAVEPLARMHPEVRAEVENIAGGLAVFAGVGSPHSEARGCGLAGPVSSDEVARLEQFFVSRGDGLRIEICPLADPGLAKTLSQRGLVITEFVSVMARQVGSEDAQVDSRGPEACGVTVRQAGPSEAGIWAEIVTRGFAEYFAPTRELQQLIECSVQARGSTAFLAYMDGQPVGGGAVFMHHRVALLGGAATLTGFRNRGVQTGLVRARLAWAAESGCDLASSSTQPGSISQRNLERQGFRVMYTRFKMARD
jgi:hypothetical protein